MSRCAATGRPTVVAAALMVGAGVRSLGMRPNRLAAIKAQLRRFSTEMLQGLARDAMQCDSSQEMRRLADNVCRRTR